MESGSIGASAAKPITDKIEAYRALQNSGAAASQGMDADVDAKMGMTMSVKGSDPSMNMAEKTDASVKGNIKMVLDKDFQMSMDMTVEAAAGGTSETQKAEYWVKDGVTYDAFDDPELRYRRRYAGHQHRQHRQEPQYQHPQKAQVIGVDIEYHPKRA